MLRLALDEPRWLLLAALAIPAVILAARWFMTMSGPRRLSAIVLRVLLLATLAVALAGLSSVRSSDRLAVIGVVDMSSSVRLFGAPGIGPDGRPGDALDAARGFLARATQNRGPEDLAGLVVFDGRATVVATPTLTDPWSRPIETVATTGTDLAGALRSAAALLPPDAAGRLVLISDGNETAGDALAAARELSGRGTLPIDVLPITLQAQHEVIVEGVDAPPRAAGEATVNVRVTLRSTAPARGILRLLLNGQPVDAIDGGSRRLDLDPGRRVEIIAVRLPPGRIHDFRAVWEPEGVAGPSSGDTRSENNSARAFTITPGQGSVLIVDPDPARANSRTLAAALAEGNIQTTTISPEGLPQSSLELQAFDLVVLANVPAELVAEPGQRAIEASVRDLGLGMVMLGGPDSLGAGGWKGTPIEPMLPVKLDLPEKVVVPDAAVVLVIDNSMSMTRAVMGSVLNKQEIANQAAALAVRSLDKRDLVGVVIFNNTYQVLIPLAANADARASADRVMTVSSAGGTNAGPAMEEALRQLREASASVRHMIVISDGVSQARDRLPEIARRAWTQDRVMVSTIGVGDEMDETIMAATAAAGGGKFYPVSDPTLLPRFLLRAVRVVRTPLVRLGDFTPLVQAAGSPITAGLPEGVPPLGGLVLTQRRPEPTITMAMTHPQGEPLLAHWVYSLGQVAAFTSDASEWAQRWIDWPGYRQLWTSLARTLARPSTSGRFDLAMTTDGDRVTVRVEGAGEDGRPLDRLTMPATVYRVDGSGSPLELTLEQVGPGVYEGVTGALGPGNYVATITPRQGEQRLTPVIGGVSVASGVEFRSLQTDTALLQRIAQASGGRVLDASAPELAGLFDRAGRMPSTSREPLLRALLIAAIVLLLLDVATRRIAWDRFVSSEFGAGVRERAASATADRSASAARAAERLRAADPAPRAEPGAALTDDDAQRLIEEQRQRRLRERLRAARASAERDEAESGVAVATSSAAKAPVAETPEPAVSEGESADAAGLLAAKKRARQRFEGS